MVDKIRQQAAGTLHPELLENLGKGFDKRCVDFLRVSYMELSAFVNTGASDEEALEWAYANGHRASEEEIEVWNGFMSKRGWKDAGTPVLVRRKKESGLESRDDIETMFDYLDVDEGRPLRASA